MFCASNSLKTFVVHKSNVQLLNILVEIACLSDACQSNGLQVDALKGKLFERVVGVGSKSFTNVLACLGREVVLVKDKFSDVVTIFIIDRFNDRIMPGLKLLHSLSL